MHRNILRNSQNLGCSGLWNGEHGGVGVSVGGRSSPTYTLGFLN